MGSSSFGRVDGAPRTLAVLIEEELAPKVIGAETDQIPAIIDALKAETEYHGTAGLATFGISAVDVALWDLVGKQHGVPTYQLWGAYRDRVPAYAMVGWSNYTLDQLRGQCAAAVAEGFLGVKMKVGAGSLDDDVARIRAVREEVGPTVKLMVDANQVLTLSEALRRGQVFEELGVEWFEEPLRADDFVQYAELTRRLRIPIAAGENLYGAREFRAFFDQPAATSCSRTSAAPAARPSSARWGRWRRRSTCPTRRTAADRRRSACSSARRRRSGWRPASGIRAGVAPARERLRPRAPRTGVRLGVTPAFI